MSAATRRTAPSTATTNAGLAVPRIGRRALLGLTAGLAMAAGFAPAHPARANDGAEPAACPPGAIPVDGACRFVSPRQRAWMQRQGGGDGLHPWFTLLASGPRRSPDRE